MAPLKKSLPRHRYFAFILVFITGMASIRAAGQTELFATAVFRTLNIPGERVDVISFSTDGRLLAIGTETGKVGLLEVTPNSTPRWLAQHSGRVTMLTFSRDGAQIASSGQDGVVKVMTVASGQATDLKGHHGKVFAVAFSPEGEFIASGGEDKTVIIWDSASGREIYRLNNGGKKAIRLVSFRESGSTVTSVVAVGEGGVISEWDVKNRSLLRQIQESDTTVLSAAANFTGTHVSIGTEFSALQKGTVTLSSGLIRPTDLYREDRIKVYDLETGKVAKTLDGINGEVKSISISADNQYIAVARVRATESFLGVFDLNRGVEIFSLPIPGDAQAVAFSPDGKWLSSASNSGEMVVLSVQGVQPKATGIQLGKRYQPVGNQVTPLISSNTNTILAVMDLDSQDNDAGMARAVSDLLRGQIAGTPGIQLVDRSRIEHILKEQDLQHSGRTDSAMAAKIGRILNARKMMVGSISKLGSSITINVQMIDVETAGIDGVRGMLCQQCAPEYLPEAVTELRPLLVSDAPVSGRSAVAPAHPRITILAPQPNQTISSGKVTLQADIDDDSGIKSADLLLNGGFDESQRIRLGSGQRSLKVQREITLEPGTNVIALHVENASGIVEEESRIVKSTGTAASRPTRTGKRWALIVGISKYQDPKIPRLEFADRDAQVLADTLATSAVGGFATERKLVLLNEQATTANITRALRSFLQKPDEDDTVIIYLAGHGAPDPKRPDNVYFISYDTQASDVAGTALPMREIEVALKENLVARRVIVLSDACHSGVIGTGGRRDLLWSESESVNRTLDELAQRAKPGTAIFTSARSGETSLESSKWGGGHGVFTWFLLQGLKGDADLNKDGIISLEELFAYVREHVKEETADHQHPVIGSGSYDPHLPIALLTK